MNKIQEKPLNISILSFFYHAFFYLKDMKIILLLTLMISNAYAIDYTFEPEFEDNRGAHGSFVIVENHYKHLFKPIEFKAKVLKIKEVLAKYESKIKNELVSIPLTNTTQEIFIERYFKTENYDAFLSDGKLNIYTKKLTKSF